MKSKNFLLFAGEDYYPLGGAFDLKGGFETIEDAIQAADSLKFRDKWAHVFDMKKESVVAHYSQDSWTWGSVEFCVETGQ